MENKKLNVAQSRKTDEFYTQLRDIELELVHYRKHFENKVVLCNCDDPYESNFFKYFALNFNTLKLKKLICTSFDGSPIAYSQLNSFGNKDVSFDNTTSRTAYKIEIKEVSDYNNDGATDISDVEWLLKNKNNSLTLLKEHGDFRSDECIEILKEADIVVTNPPFSLFREYVAQLVEYDKRFIILGNINAITYKEFFPLIIENKVWLGCSIHSGDREFRVPNYYKVESKSLRIDDDGYQNVRVPGVRWYTNLDYKERHEPLILYKTFNPDNYPKYDNYDAINVDKTTDIPCDYYGAMGVPISFLDKYCPEQFELIGCTESEGKGFSRGLWDEASHVSQPLINNKKIYKRLFVKRRS